MGVSPRGATRRLLESMKEAGFAQIDCTPDSASPAMIRGLCKGFALDDLVEAARGARAADLPTMWFFVFGGPGETEATFAESLEFIDREIRSDDMVHMAAGLRIFPGTPLHDRAVAEGLVDARDSLLEPRFYVSPSIGAERLHALVREACQARPNCVPAWESTPDASMRVRAAELRRTLALEEPMFRTLLRVRRERLAGAS